MKKKELKNLATKMAKYEAIVQTSNDKYAITQAQEKIMELSSCVDSFEDMIAIDEIVMEILEKNSKIS